jgi:glycosyltransferase involved in cell wall biosynthesis
VNADATALTGAEAPVMVIARQAGGVPDEGFRIFIRELAKRLRAKGPAVVYTAGGEPAPGMVLVSNLRPLVSIELQRAIRRHRPRAIIYIHRLTTLALLRARYFKLLGRGCRTVVIDLQPSGLGWLGRLLGRGLWPDLLLVASEADRRRVAALGATVKIIAMATDLGRFRPADPGEKEVIRHRWGLPAETDLVLHVGHLKGSRNLLSLVPIAGRPNTTVAVVVSRGREASSDALQAELEAAGVVVLEGYRPDVEEIYRAADCYVFPVIDSAGAIAMPLSVLEALASDVPVVTTSYGALPDRFTGVEGVLFADTAEAIRAAVEEQLRRRPAGRRLAEPFTWDAVIQGLL